MACSAPMSMHLTDSAESGSGEAPCRIPDFYKTLILSTSG